MKNVINSTAARVGAGSAVLLGLSGAAHAELPAEVATAFGTISTNYTDLAAVAWPVIGTIVGGFILVKLFKKFANKAS